MTLLSVSLNIRLSDTTETVGLDNAFDRDIMDKVVAPIDKLNNKPIVP
ncbi:hypothetical protein BN193_06980 [Lactococcus raffinolactis 4877]|nr:hypothetical protein BN193_06980 [Lactococcus raffinolactis 4877]